MESGGREIGRVAGDWPTAALAVLLILGFARATAAQYREPVDPYRFFVDASIGGIERALGGEVQFDSQFVWHGERGTGRALYPRRSREGLAPLVDIGGGMMFTDTAGAGLALTRASFGDAVTRLEVVVPHPTFLDAAAGASGATGAPLTSRVTTLHASAVLAIARTPRYEVRVWGGPAFITYTADLVRLVTFAQSASTDSPAQTVTVTGFESTRVSSSTVGASLGADLTIFLSDTFGVGAGVRHSRGAAAIDLEPMSGQRQEVLVGGTLVSVGLRVRLDRDRR